MKKELEKKLEMWKRFKQNAIERQNEATSEDSKRIYGYGVARCEKGIQDCKAKLAEFIGRK